MKHRVEIRHQQRRRHSLARNIAEQKIKLIAGFNDVDVIAADNSGRLINVMNMPLVAFDANSWQQALLDVERELKIILERSTLLVVQAPEAHFHQRIR